MTSASKPAAAASAAEAILDRIRELLMGFDLEWRCTYLNRSAREYAGLLGLSGDDLIGRVVWDAIPELRDSPFYKAAMRRGLSIPGDLSVVGYDDSPLAAQLWPALTTIHSPIRDLGRQAAQMLLGDEPAGDDAPNRVSPQLVVRDSSQRPKA